MKAKWIKVGLKIPTDTVYTTVDAANGFAPTAQPEPTTKYFASEESYQRLTLKGILLINQLKLKARPINPYSVTMAELFDCYLGDIPQINTGVTNPLPTGECNKDRATGFNNVQLFHCNRVTGHLVVNLVKLIQNLHWLHMISIQLN